MSVPVLCNDRKFNFISFLTFLKQMGIYFLKGKALKEHKTKKLIRKTYNKKKN